MSHQLEDLETEVCEIWAGQGVRLEIVATWLPEELWTVSVINERGIMSTWHEFFPTAEAAMAAARTAIEEEGIEDFVSIEGFEYIDELPDPPSPH